MSEATAGRYVSVPTEVDAIRWWPNRNDANVADFCTVGIAEMWKREDGTDGPFSQVFDRLHNAWIPVFDGQWVIRGTKGELYPCDDEVFRAKYRPVDGG